mmetsp:Transcript_51110/g.128276  ORF Transcript_51110/g.128276 Transcript_51110/m.128276 type:complete len:171 (+) Transcript_51110:352-864(+)
MAMHMHCTDTMALIDPRPWHARKTTWSTHAQTGHTTPHASHRIAPHQSRRAGLPDGLKNNIRRGITLARTSSRQGKKRTVQRPSTHIINQDRESKRKNSEKPQPTPSIWVDQRVHSQQGAGRRVGPPQRNPWIPLPCLYRLQSAEIRSSAVSVYLLDAITFIDTAQTDSK